MENAFWGQWEKGTEGKLAVLVHTRDVGGLDWGGSTKIGKE